jgi:glycosylphosphatidylinositol transamidase (GPIT) subunit GPI8
MNKVDAANAMSIIKNYVPEKNIITYNTKGGGLTPTATAILNKIGEVCQSDECSFLYIFMSAHGGHSGSGSNECSYMQFKGGGAQAISNLTGKALWEKVKDAKCKIFLMIHTCHAGGFFNDPSPA